MHFDYSVNMSHNDFRTQILTVEELIYRFDETDATNSVSVFRKPTVVQSSRIIESVLLGMPQPMLYIDDSNSKWVVVEGAEHLYAYYSFCLKGMKLSSLYFKKQQYEGRTFNDLSPLAQSNILNTKITVNVLNPGLTAHERFGVYLCLKSRIDSTSLRWCRSKIYPEEYQWVKDLAKELMQRSNRTETMEAVICYMLVGRDYDFFLEGSGLNHIDAVANRLLEKVYQERLVEEISDGFKTVLKAYKERYARFVRMPKAEGVYASVLYNLYRKQGSLRKISANDFNSKIQGVALLGRDESAEAFCRNINAILNRFE